MINIERIDKIDVVSFTISRINALITDEIVEALMKIFENNTNSKVIINLQGVGYIDSSGFGCFLTVMKAARNTYSTLKFANPEPGVMELFETLQLKSVFQIYQSMDSCLRSFN